MFKNLSTMINRMEWKVTVHVKAGTNTENFPRSFEIEGPAGMQTVEITYVINEENQ